LAEIVENRRKLKAGKEKRQALAVNFSWFVFKDVEKWKRRGSFLLIGSGFVR